MNKTPLPSGGLQSVSYSTIAGQGGGTGLDLKKHFLGGGQCSAVVTGTDSEDDRPGIASQLHSSPAVCPQASNLTSLSFMFLTWKVKVTVSTT